MFKQVFSAALFLFSVVMLAPAGQADEVTAAMRQADARLQARVTIRSPHIMIGELLERLSKQSGVTLAADEWSTAGSDSVTVSLRNVPLSEAMNALWSLFSYQHAEWDWYRRPLKGQTGKYTYTLTRPDNARFLAERLQGQVQTEFEAQAQELFDSLDMPPAQLAEAAKHDELLDSLKDDGRVRQGMLVLASLPPETLFNLLRHHEGLTIPIADLSPEAQKAVHAGWDCEIAAAAKQNIPASAFGTMSSAISIGVAIEPGNVAPAVNMEYGMGSGDYFGGGFMQKPWQAKMNAQWRQPGDGVDDPLSARSLSAFKPTPNPANQAPTVSPMHPLADYLLRFAETTQVPLIARIPLTLDAGTPLGTLSQVPSSKTVKIFLEQAQPTPLLLDYKWRGGVLLLTCQNWFVEESEGARLPWTEVRRLRDKEAAGDGFLSLGDIAHAANVLNDAQMKTLGEWFPVMTNAAEWHDFLAFYDKWPEYRPRVLSAKGDDFQEPENLLNAQLGIGALRVTNPNLRLRISEKVKMEIKPPTHQLALIVLNDTGSHGLYGHWFDYEAHEYQGNLKVDETMTPAVPMSSPVK